MNIWTVAISGAIGMSAFIVVLEMMERIPDNLGAGWILASMAALASFGFSLLVCALVIL